MNEQRTDKKPERAAEPRRKETPPNPEQKTQREALDEKSLDDVLRDCPL